MVVELQDITQLKNFAGAQRTAIVTDPLRGGVFNWSSEALTDDDGTIFTATGVGEGFWVRDFNPEQGLNVKWFGALGDGVTDDSTSIKAALLKAKNGNVKKVYFPEGIYMISETLYFASNVVLFGDGRMSSIIRNHADAVTGLDLITLISGIVTNPDIYTYKTMVSSEGADYTVGTTISGFKIHDLGFDWNGINGGVNSVQELLLGRVEDYIIENVKFYDALPADLEDVNEERQGHQIQLAFSTRGFLNNIYLGASDYESLAIRYLSHNNHFGTVYGYVDKPDTYHWQSHIIQIARPTAALASLIAQYGDSVCRDNSFDNLYLHTKNNVLHGLTTHSSEGIYMNFVYHKSYAGANALAWGVKFFDESKNVTIGTFVEDALDANTNAFPATSRGVTSNGVSFIGINSTSTHDPVDNITISNVLINVRNTVDYDGALPSYIAPMMGGCNLSTGSNVTFGDIVVNIDGFDDYAKPVFGCFGDNVTVNSLSINLSNPFEAVTSAGLYAVRIKDGDNVEIKSLKVVGDIANGVLLDNTSFNNVRLGSMVYDGTVAGVKVSTGLTSQAQIKITANSVNGITADADGNIAIAIPTVDATPTDGSTNAVSSNGVFDALALKVTTPASTGYPYWNGGTATYVTGSSATVIRGDGVTVARNPLVFQNATLPSSPVPSTVAVALGDTVETIVNKLLGQLGLRANLVGTSDIEITDTTKGVILKSPDGTRYRITVANGGTLVVTAV